ncbi:cbb3-type cytochrome c oxidase subunit I [Telmatospirillum sp.]|uniref:cbb3-type cytochrome c oxidase subunit I n=1 Tax=Telmatospirillum sp. TaxID=2079197 RepID=UPI0028506E8E|nr:cbb3-type cytochrome c oxidase subunit I [Telmatospirillum sp.]MDR3440282.1 cbb3-type cytochrome c oxidase subunit I [Telmatospirillum sp.]
MKDTLQLPSGVPPVGFDQTTRRILAGWLFLAIGSLAVAGGLALLLALARTPHAQDWLPWPWESFFRKALVAHVVFAFVVWYLAMLGGLASATRPGRLTGASGLMLAVVGALLLLIPTLSNQGEPSLNNYVPVLVHPLFYAGLICLAAGVALPVLHLLARPPVWGGGLAVGVGTAGMLYLLALLCFFLAWFGGARESGSNEQLFWGGGHLLQFVHTALLLTAWQLLGEQTFGVSPLPPKAWHAVCALLVLAGLPGPLLYAFHAAASEELRQAFTRLYWIGLPIPPVIVGLAVLRRIVAGPRNWHSTAFVGLVLSITLFTLGGVFGGFANGGDTRTPAHYHAAIGGVNLAFMGMFFVFLLPLLLKNDGQRRSVRLSFWLYGGGQALFSLGMFLAGTAGVGRKIAGAEQGLDSLIKVIGMALTGAGGAVAVTGGVMFVWLALARLSSAPTSQ